MSSEQSISAFTHWSTEMESDVHVASKFQSSCHCPSQDRRKVQNIIREFLGGPHRHKSMLAIRACADMRTSTSLRVSAVLIYMIPYVT